MARSPTKTSRDDTLKRPRAGSEHTSSGDEDTSCDDAPPTQEDVGGPARSKDELTTTSEDGDTSSDDDLPDGPPTISDLLALFTGCFDTAVTDVTAILDDEDGGQDEDADAFTRLERACTRLDKLNRAVKLFRSTSARIQIERVRVRARVLYTPEQWVVVKDMY